MSMELAVQKAQDIHVIAETPDQMKECNTSLINWCDAKIRELRVDHIELDAAYKSALAKKWKSSVLKRHAKLAKKRILFYGKLRTALKAGWYIVPNFPVTIFAIRTDRSRPLRIATTVQSSYTPSPRKDQQTYGLPEGTGNYVSPNPVVQVRNHGEVTLGSGRKETEWHSFASDWNDVEFPMCMAKLQIMEATNRAMEIKLFDDFGVLSNAALSRRGCGDPIIVGRILDPRSTTYTKKYISFIIAWALDTKTI